MIDVQLSLYLQDLAETIESRADVEAAANTVSWVHQLAGLEAITSPCNFRECRLSRSSEEVI